MRFLLLSVHVFLLVVGIVSDAPSIQAQWLHTSGPYGARCTAFGNIGSIQFVGTSSGIFRSTNEGAEWVRVHSLNSAVTAMASIGTTLFVATGGEGVLSSRDSGLNWLPENYKGLPETYLYVYSLSANNGYLFAGTESYGAYRSSDTGKSWTQINDGFEVVNQQWSISAMGSSGKYVFASCYGGLYRCDFNGTLWTNMHIPGSNVTITSLTTSGYYLVVGTSTGGIFRSGLDGRGYIRMDSGRIGGSLMALASDGSNLFAGTTRGVFLSTDLGSSWNVVSNGLTDSSVLSLSSSAHTLLAGTQVGVFRSSDYGASWTLASNGLEFAPVASLLYSNGSIFAGTQYGAFRSSDGGTNWEPINRGLPSHAPVTALANIGTTLFAGTDPGDVFRSKDDGNSWESASDSLKYPSVSTLWSVDSFLFTVDWQGGCDPQQEISRSTDMGATWTSTDSLRLGVPSAFTTLGDYFFAGGGSYGGALFRTSDKGRTWVEADSGIRPLGIYSGTAWTGVSAIATIGSQLIASANDGMYLSNDTGFSWKQVGTGQGSYYYMHTLLVAGGVLIGSSLHGMWASLDTGVTWTRIDKGLTDTNVTALVITDTTLFAGTQTGVWRRSLSEIVKAARRGTDQDVTLSASIIDGITMADNRSVSVYPNPVSHSATIHFISRESGTVEIALLNLLGTKVASLFSGEIVAGEHFFSWDVSEVAAGAYECVLRINGSAEAATSKGSRHVPVMVAK